MSIFLEAATLEPMEVREAKRSDQKSEIQPGYYTVVENHIVFVAEDRSDPFVLVVVDPKGSAEKLPLREILPEGRDEATLHLSIPIEDNVVFVTEHPKFGLEFWTFDKEARHAQSFGGAWAEHGADLSASTFLVLAGRLLLTANGKEGSELWVTDGGEKSLGIVPDVSITGGVKQMLEVANKILVVAHDDVFHVGAQDVLVGSVLEDNGDGSDVGPEFRVVSINGFEFKDGEVIKLVSGATVTINAEGKFEYHAGTAYDSLAKGETGTDTFEYRIADGRESAAGSDTGLVTIEIQGINDAPVAMVIPDQAGQINAPFTVDLSTFFHDVDNGDTLRFSILAVDENDIPLTNQPLWLSINSETGVVSGMPTDGIETQRFKIIATDGAGESAASAFTLTVDAVANAVPVLSLANGSAEAIEQIAIVVDDTIRVMDSDSASLSSASVAITGGFDASQDSLDFVNTDVTAFGDIVGEYDGRTGVLILGSAGGASASQFEAALRAVTYLNSVDRPDITDRTITLTVNDGIANSLPISKVISIHPENDGPIVHDDVASVDQRLLTSGNVLTDGTPDSDPDGDTLVVAAIGLDPVGDVGWNYHINCGPVWIAYNFRRRFLLIPCRKRRVALLSARPAWTTSPTRSQTASRPPRLSSTLR